MYGGRKIRLGEGEFLDPDVIANYVPKESPWGKMDSEARERYGQAVRVAEVNAIAEVATSGKDGPGILPALSIEVKRLVDKATDLKNMGKISNEEMLDGLYPLFVSFKPENDCSVFEYVDSDGTAKQADIRFEGGMVDPQGLHIRYNETKRDEKMWGDVSLRIPIIKDKGGLPMVNPWETKVLGSEGTLRGYTLSQAVDHIVSTANVAAQLFEGNAQKVQKFLDGKSE